MEDFWRRYLCRLALWGISASSAAVYSSTVNPHFAQHSLIFSVCIVVTSLAGNRNPSNRLLAFFRHFLGWISSQWAMAAAVPGTGVVTTTTGFTSFGWDWGGVKKGSCQSKDANGRAKRLGGGAGLVRSQAGKNGVGRTVNDFTGCVALGNYIAVAVNRNGHISNFDDFERLATGTVFGLNGLNFYAEIVPSCQPQSQNTNKIWWRRRELNPRAWQINQPRLHV
jgi:hypothetical protein